MTMSPGMQRKSVADAASVLTIVSDAGYVYYSDGELNYSGGAISGVASYTWAQFNDAGFDLTIARYVHITDRHSTTDGTSTPGSLWWVDPTATAIRKRNLVSGPIYYATLADAPNPTSWPNLMVAIGSGCGIGVPTLRSNGTSYRFDVRAPQVMAQALSVVKAAVKTDEEAILSFTIPIDANNKSLLQPNDQIIINTHIGKSGTANTITRKFRLGTSASVLTNTQIDTITTSAGASIGIDDTPKFVVVSDTSVWREGAQGGVTDPGVTSTPRNTSVAVTSLNSAIQYFSGSFMLVGGTADTLTSEIMSISILHSGT